MTLAANFEWRQNKRGKWQLWEQDKSRQLMQWYHEGAGRTRLVRDLDRNVPPKFTSVQQVEEFLRQFQWGRHILGEHQLHGMPASDDQAEYYKMDSDSFIVHAKHAHKLAQ